MFTLSTRALDSPWVPLPDLPSGAQQPVERGLRAEVGALVEQDRPHLGRRQVHEPRRVQHVEDRLPLDSGQRPRLHPLAGAASARVPRVWG